MASKPQDMPPPGGYEKIMYKRIPARGKFDNFLFCTTNNFVFQF